MAQIKSRLVIKIFRLIEGEAEGPLAIMGLIVIVAVLAVLWHFGSH